MKATVIIPCFNEPEQRIAETVASAKALPGVEVIVVDDGSAVPVVADAKVIRLPENLGCSAALNLGIDQADQDSWIIRCDCGDILLDNKLAQIEEAIATGYVASFSDSVDLLNGEVLSPGGNWYTGIFTDSKFAASASVFRKTVWEAVGGYDAALTWADDWDFAVRVHAKYRWHYYPHVTANVACYPGGITDRGKQHNEARHRDRAVVAKRAREMSREVVL